MRFLEKNLEDIIYETDGCSLCERGLNLYAGKKYRQVRIGNYGIVDMLNVHKHFEELPHAIGDIIIPCLHIDILELKQHEIGVSTLNQAAGYMKGIKRYLEYRKFKFHVEYSIWLIGSKIQEGNFIYLSDLIESDHQSFIGFNLNILTYSYEFDGIKFKQYNNYSLINEGFE